MEITAESAFELSDESSTTAEADVLGVWRLGPPAPSVAFTASRSTPPEVPLWRIDLPAEPLQAARRLAAGQARLLAASHRLADATARLDAVLDRSRPGVAFTTDTSIPGGSAEAELVGWLQRPGEAGAAGPGSALAAFTNRLASYCRPSALVETQLQGEPVARSLLGLGGNVRTVCRPGLGPRGAGLHRDGVSLVVGSRAALLRVVACVTRGAVAISVRLALPGGPVLALPVAWRFVQRVLAEVDRGRTRSP